MPEFITKEKLGEVLASKSEYQTPKGKAAVTRMLVKQGHEIEGINASFSGLNAAANVFPSLYELGKGIVKMVVDYDEKSGVELKLDDTIKGISNAAIGGIANLVDKAGGDAKNSVGADIVSALGGDVGKQQEAARGIYNFYQQRYGSVEKLQETIERDPAGFLADVAGLFSGGASAAKGLVKGAQVAGATGLASKIATAQTFLTRTAQAVEPLGIVPKAVSATANKANSVLGITENLRKLPSKAFGRDLFSGAQIKEISGKSFTKDVGERLANWGITGSLDDMTRQLGEIETKSAAAVDNALAGVKTLHKNQTLKNVIDILEENLTGLRDQQSKDFLKEILKAKSKLTDREIVTQVSPERLKPYRFEPITSTEGKKFYHGTRAELESLDKVDPLQYGEANAMFGFGVYLTDNPSIAKGYSKTKGSKSGVGKVFEVELPKLKLLDLEKPFPDDVKKLFDSVSPYESPLFGKNGREVFDDLRESFKYERYPSDDVHSIYQELSTTLKDKFGYDGFNHIGGHEGKGDHNVVILFPSGKNQSSFGEIFKKSGTAKTDIFNVNTIKQKIEGSGITLSEANRVKRLLGKLKGEAAFRAQGGVKATNTGRELGNLYGELKGFIEDEAGKAGVKNIRELNNQNQFAMLTRKGLEKMQVGSAKRDNFTGVLVESMAAGYTGGWSLLYSIPARLVRSPQFQRDLATAVKLMDDADFKTLEGGIKFSRKEGKLEKATRTAQRTARITAPARARLDQVMAKLRQLYPEVRVLTAGQVEE